MDTYTLYSLSDDQGVFWVGTTKNLKQRHYSHRRQVSPTYPRSLACEVQGVGVFDSKAECLKAETRLIEFLRRAGITLLNTNASQAVNLQQPEWRANLSRAAKQRWADPVERERQAERLRSYHKSKK